jgi:hypothetical protein
METCKICNESFKNLKSLSAHFNIKHKLSSKEYYDKYLIKDGDGKCSVCNNETTYRNLGVGYLSNCSTKCRGLNKNIKRDTNKGKKQSKETIEKRIKNTNQIIKEENRKKTMLNKYGFDNPTKISHIKDKMSKSLTGKKQNRTEEWQKNIINSKKKNGTLKHTDETKNKISNSVNTHYLNNLDREKYITTSDKTKHLSGWYKGLYFRSSLELSFLINNKDIVFKSCETNKYGIKYEINNKIKIYYPDYTDGEYIYEIKPTNLLNFSNNPIKINTGKKYYGEKYKVITEKESPYVTKELIFNLIENEEVFLTKNAFNILKKYNH